jgi:hypothetical protein
MIAPDKATRMCISLPRAAAQLGLAVLVVAALASPSAAQFQPPGSLSSQPAVGERYHVEAAISFWSPQPDLVVSSESLGIVGDEVDLVDDLGVEQKRLRELKFVLRPATKHKFRINYLPIEYEAEAVVQREFVFNGQRYRVGLPVNTSAKLTTWRFGYEYDFLYRDRGFAGVFFDLKYTDVDVELDSPIGREFTAQVAPIPTFGFVGRGYVVPNVSITGELSFFKMPDGLAERFNGGGRYIDYDFYGTVNFTNNVGAQIGFKSVHVDYFQDLDGGTLNFTGWYFGAVARF